MCRLFNEYGAVRRGHGHCRPPRAGKGEMMPGKVMRGPRVLAIDQVTTRTKAVMVDGAGQVIARASAPLTTGYPHPGRAEQSAGAIWASVQLVIADIMAQAGLPDATAIANQRETMVIWDAETGLPLCPARIWQCRRTDPLYAALIAEGHNPAAVAATGLDINPLFAASTLAWVLREVPAAQAALALGRVRAGTVDCWLLWNLTGGAFFACDHSNASRTQLFDTWWHHGKPHAIPRGEQDQRLVSALHHGR